MTTPQNTTGSDAPTEDFSASRRGSDATPTKNVSAPASANPTLPYPESAFLAEEHDVTKNFFAPNTDKPTTAEITAAAPPRLRPRFGTILWGILLLAFATYMVVFTLLPVPPDPTLWLLGGVIAVGLGLVVAGIAAAARRAD
ncbi:hypothetical protein E3O25_15425 [Cryobacterium sp. TMT1-3]|uniref:Uncharacterized protein n=1 Tax=Cryobacterium luteum TaxID=1424661 RepID=A0A1H8AHV2_9MICO|nr:MULTISPECIES: hypothetical protein [Cryobacterium]TFB88532.1 hypothetical protein E3O10_12075 [Cryobacterium luteum]TFC24558.1 hypothetical protein E3O25_15425 [Cryobacterium sp. TMT1-3]SEM70355.1 hypothetical protein SAMN05216281_101195 [Cryobacterium luteum]